MQVDANFLLRLSCSSSKRRFNFQVVRYLSVLDMLTVHLQISSMLNFLTISTLQTLNLQLFSWAQKNALLQKW